MGRSKAPSHGRVASKRMSAQKKFSESSVTWEKKLCTALAKKEAALEYEDRTRMHSDKYILE